MSTDPKMRAPGNGAVFAINPDGTGFATVHSFAPGGYNSLGFYTNSDGANPSARLILSGDTLYGTANAGGSSGHGTVFVVKTNGTGFSNLYSFTATPRYPETQTNSDGANPQAGLIQASDGNFYGTTWSGGVSGVGTVFKMDAAGTLTTLHSFSNSDGANPLYLIGDPKQAIYRFRGGDVYTYMEARKAMFALSRKGMAQGRGLDTNFRSSAAMVAACNATFLHAGWFQAHSVDPADAAWRLAAEPDPLGYLPVRSGDLAVSVGGATVRPSRSRSQGTGLRHRTSQRPVAGNSSGNGGLGGSGEVEAVGQPGHDGDRQHHAEFGPFRQSSATGDPDIQRREYRAANPPCASDAWKGFSG